MESEYTTVDDPIIKYENHCFTVSKKLMRSEEFKTQLGLSKLSNEVIEFHDKFKYKILYSMHELTDYPYPPPSLDYHLLEKIKDIYKNNFKMKQKMSNIKINTYRIHHMFGKEASEEFLQNHIKNNAKNNKETLGLIYDGGPERVVTLSISPNKGWVKTSYDVVNGKIESNERMSNIDVVKVK